MDAVNGAIARLMRQGLVTPGLSGRFLDSAGPLGDDSTVYELTHRGRAELETLGYASWHRTASWPGAEAAKPPTRTIHGVVLGPREVDPAIRRPR